jgi:hypothetical protein
MAAVELHGVPSTNVGSEMRATTVAKSDSAAIRARLKNAETQYEEGNTSILVYSISSP